MADADSDLPIERDEARRWSLPNDVAKIGLVPRAGPAPVGAADAPVHAPAATARAAHAEQILERWPEVRRERLDDEML